MTKQDEPTFTPIEEPEDPVMEQIYAARAKERGKVITPLKSHSARLPTAFIQFYGKMGKLDNNFELASEIAFVNRQRVPTLNECAFTIDSTCAYSIKQSMSHAKADALGAYAKSPLFSDAERAAVDYASELTSTKRAGQETFDRLRPLYSEREVCGLVCLAAGDQLFDLPNKALNIQPDMLSEIASNRTGSLSSGPD